MNLDIEELYDEGKFTLKFSFPQEYYPKVQEYNRCRTKTLLWFKFMELRRNIEGFGLR